MQEHPHLDDKCPVSQLKFTQQFFCYVCPSSCPASSFIAFKLQISWLLHIFTFTVLAIPSRTKEVCLLHRLSRWNFLNVDFSMKNWQKIKTKVTFKIYSSWWFQCTHYMFDLSKNWLRKFQLKNNQFLFQNFDKDYTPVSWIWKWQALFSCPAWYCQYCI